MPNHTDIIAAQAAADRQAAQMRARGPGGKFLPQSSKATPQAREDQEEEQEEDNDDHEDEDDNDGNADGQQERDHPDTSDDALNLRAGPSFRPSAASQPKGSRPSPTQDDVLKLLSSKFPLSDLIDLATGNLRLSPTGNTPPRDNEGGDDAPDDPDYPEVSVPSPTRDPLLPPAALRPLSSIPRTCHCLASTFLLSYLCSCLLAFLCPTAADTYS